MEFRVIKLLLAAVFIIFKFKIVFTVVENVSVQICSVNFVLDLGMVLGG
jgi:hypothetical protein